MKTFPITLSSDVYFSNVTVLYNNYCTDKEI